MATIAGFPNSSPKVYSRKALSLITVCFVLSGATGLIYEVLWARMLGLVFGATTLAISAVLCAFMGGLALGSALAGRLATRISRPILGYGAIEILVGFYALCVPPLFRGIDWAYAAIWQHWHPGFYGFALSRFVLAAMILTVPTTLMGATLPVLAAAVERSSDKRRNTIATLYTCNLAGAIVGTVAAGFLLLPSLGVRMTIWIAAAINLLIGAVALFIDPRTREDHELTATSEEIEPGAAAVLKIEDVKFWLFIAFISGFVTIGMQLVWSRLLSMIVGSSTYAFSIVLALFLGGLSLGAYAISRKRKRDATSLRRTVLIIEILIAASLFMSIVATNAVPVLLIQGGFRLSIDSWIGLLALQIVAAGMLVLLPAVLMGMVMPSVLLRAQASKNGREGESLSRGWHSAVRFVGQSYALNTIGAIAGAVVTAFVLIPKTGSRFTIFGLASLCVIAAGITYEPPHEVSDRALTRSLAAGAVAILIIAMFASWPRLNLDRLSIGAYDSFVRVLAKSRGAVAENHQQDGPEDHQLLMYDEGRTATVSVRRDWNITSIAINGRTNASDAEDMPTQIMLGQLGVLIAPRLNKALVVGFATGVTVGSVLQSPINSVECVEIEPAAVTASHYFEHVNNRPLIDPRLHLIIDDARTYLRVNPTTYDLIVSEPSHPWVPGVANLFTREFFSLGRERLNADGVFVQWLQTYQLSTESLRSILATFHDVFPRVAVFRVQGTAKGKDLILIASNSPLGFDRISERLGDERISREIARAGIKNADDLRRDWFVCDESQLGRALAGALINFDDNMLVETRAPREAFRATLDQNAVWIEGLKKSVTLNR